MFDWGLQRKVIFPQSLDYSLLKIASNLEKRIPTTKQAKRILDIRENLLIAGYKED
jgi:hypothetical protein